MAKLVPLEEWRKSTFAEPRPSIRTCQKWAKEGHLPGARKFGALWFVDEKSVQTSTGNPLVDQVLQAN